MPITLAQNEIYLIGQCGAAINRVYTRAFNLINMLEGRDQLSKPEELKVLHAISEALWDIEHRLDNGSFLSANIVSQLDDIKDVVFTQLDELYTYTKEKKPLSQSTSEIARNNTYKEAMLADLDKANAALKAMFDVIDSKLTPDLRTTPSPVILEEA